MDTKKETTYRVQLREWYVWDLYVTDVASLAEAMKKAEAFYASQRKPPVSLKETGVSASLQEKSVRLGRRYSGPSPWAKTQGAARDSQRDAAQAA